MANLKIKICGITRLEDAQVAVAAGADALGFVFFPGSPRCLSQQAARDIIRHLPPFIAKVGVFVNPDEQTVLQAIAECDLDTLQFHGEEPPPFCRRFRGLKVIKAFRIQDKHSLQSLPPYKTYTDAWLLDSFVPGRAGGTATTFNWDLALQAKSLNHPILLAGGLTPENVAGAVQQVHPFGVDVSSGVESAPAKKDPDKLLQFIQAARRA
jgi:phosphoribosylanthranilate isomerase